MPVKLEIRKCIHVSQQEKKKKGHLDVVSTSPQSFRDSSRSVMVKGVMILRLMFQPQVSRAETRTVQESLLLHIQSVALCEMILCCNHFTARIVDMQSSS